MALLDYYLEGRRFEWVITISMLWLAIAMAISPEILPASAFQWVTLVMSPSVVDAALFAIGWVRLIGLVLNGHQVRGHRVGPAIRSIMAIGCAVMRVQFDLALVQLSLAQGFMSPGLPFRTMFVVGEVDVAHRAVRGQRGGQRDGNGRGP
ncbi:hypothetical protein QA640_19935 [Bradyrhizobium sp. CB82]|uniref:hypothetical protein n=1 Tax=Bradyrhizobium sp. CB82 TaxID=3039159 RepID=UPI0024B0CA94|nr:hypothetical protein [Bradyrhizobium sp. CB82]WFU44512.1 hypothetical protein QA640_19935 [Bradyrhizobium sp. CB82]